MDDLKQLVEDFIEYTGTWSICDTEWYWNVDCVRKSECTNNEHITDEEFDIAIRQEILYAFIYNIGSIEYQMENDLQLGYESDRFDNDSIEMEKKIQKLFPTFKLERY